MTDEECDEKMKNHKARRLAGTAVKVGDVFYNYENPLSPWKVINYTFLGGLYWHIINEELGEFRREKNSVMNSENRYHEYYKTSHQALERAIAVQEEELLKLKELHKNIIGELK